jgi:hypothetical protein
MEPYHGGHFFDPFQ